MQKLCRKIFQFSQKCICVQKHKVKTEKIHPDEIILYAILDNENFDLSLSLNTIEQNSNSVGTVFAINKPGLQTKIENLTAKFPNMVFNDQAGVKEIQFKKKPTAYSILDKYYAN